MINKGCFNIIGTDIQACDYDYVVEQIQIARHHKEKILITPLASHTLVQAYTDSHVKHILARFNLRVPDSQWVKKSLTMLYGIQLKERVYGPELMLRLCNLSNQNNLKIYLYGTTAPTLAKLSTQLQKKYPQIHIVGSQPSIFRELTNEEQQKLINDIKSAEPNIIFIGLGSPKQEKFAVWLHDNLTLPAAYIPVGAAFDFISQTKKQAPQWMGDIGLEWFYRLMQEPSRLWKRYLIGGIQFTYYVAKQYVAIGSK